MDRKELLKKYHDLEIHNALCYSENLLITKPKKGYEEQWREATERADALEALMQEEAPMKDEQMVYTILEVARILKIGKNRVYELKNRGFLPFIKLGALKCSRQSLEGFLRKYEGYDLTDLTNIKPLMPDGSMEDGEA